MVGHVAGDRRVVAEHFVFHHVLARLDGAEEIGEWSAVSS